jgi:uncharacterized protein YuzE
LPLADVREASRALAKLPWDEVNFHYDREADVLYIHLKDYEGMAYAKDLVKEGILLEYAGKELVGIVILDASQR